jgi:hypothetical protein|tara:strand:- start:624 stop:869 length:246 start_codon:yes stop_codon:yes gene_type:complete
MTKIVNKNETATIRTSIGLRDALFDELDALRDGTSNPQKSQATAKLAVQIINSVKMEIDYGLSEDVISRLTKTNNLQLGTC